jgi:GntR family transcriptional regulator
MFNIGDPCIAIDTIAYTSNEEIIEYSRTIFRGDPVHFIIERHS